jgi:hypothetical protein
VKSGGADKEKKTATIELLAPDLRNVIGKLTLNGVGIIKVGNAAVSTSKDEPRKVRAEAFIESVQIDQF